MIKTLKMSNFRSIKEGSIDFAPVTFLYGENAAGKSSIFYALNVLRNVITDPNQTVETFFNLGFINLGGFSQVVYKHNEKESIIISAGGKIGLTTFTYRVTLNNKAGELYVEVGKPYFLKLTLPVSFPYPSNGSAEQQIKIEENLYKVNWNGLTFQVNPEPATDQTTKNANEITIFLNSIVESIRSVDVVPMMRGFTKANYGIVSSDKFPVDQDQVIAKLATDDILDRQVSTYLEQVMDRQSNTKAAPGTTQVHLYTTEKESKQTIDIVNDGFGVNQLVYLISKALMKNLEIVCIEEPEINLHPRIINRLLGLFVELARDEGRQIIVSTHSEILMLSVLNAVSKGLIRSNDVAAYLFHKNRGLTFFRKESISKEGQIEGGLVSFIADNVADITNFFPKKNKSSEAPSIEEKLTGENSAKKDDTEKKEETNPKSSKR